MLFGYVFNVASSDSGGMDHAMNRFAMVFVSHRCCGPETFRRCPRMASRGTVDRRLERSVQLLVVE